MDAWLQRAMSSAASAMIAGETEGARGIIQAALASATDPASRAELLCLQTRLGPTAGDAYDLVKDVLDTVGQVEQQDPVLAGRLLLELVTLKLYRRDADVLAIAVRAQELTATADRVTRARADCARGLAHVFDSDYDSAHDFLLRSADVIRVGGPPHEVAQLLQEVVLGLASVERYAEALVLCRRHVRAVRAVGADGLLPIVLGYLANTAYFVSDFAQMETAAAEAYAVARGVDQGPIAAYCRGMVGLARTLTGDPEASGAELQASVDELLSTSMRVLAGLPLMGLGLRELTRGDWPAAAECYAQLREFHSVLPPMPGVLHWRADEVEALWRAGRAADARARLVDMQARRSGYGPWEQAVTSRAAALVAATAHEAEESFVDALAHHERSASSFERARTELCYGEWLMAQGRAERARIHLQSAFTTFEELGTTTWRDRARVSLSEAPPARPAQEDGPAPSVRAFGPLTLVHAGVEIPVGLDTQGRLLRSLAAAGGSMHAEHVIDTLWPDADGEAGGSRLRNVLTRVRRSYGPVVIRDGALLRWAEGVDVDVDRFRDLCRRAAGLRSGTEAAELAREAVDLYRDDLLPLERYDADIIATRERMRLRYLSMLDLLAEHEVAEGRVKEAADHLRTAIDVDPLDEARYARLAALLLDQGRRLQARAVLSNAVRAISELGLPVSPQLAELEQRLAQPDA